MDAELFKTIWPIFIQEAREHLEALSSGILELERDPASRTPDLLVSVCRTAHSLKGSSASIGLADVETLAHVLEDAVAPIGAQGRLNGKLVEALLRVVENIDTALTRIEQGGSPEIPELNALISSLREHTPGGGTGAHGNRAPGGGADAGTSRVATHGPATGGGSVGSSDASEGGDPGVVEEIWPVFRGEVCEYLEALRAGFEKEGRDLVWLERVSHSLAESASTLGLKGLERLTHALETTFHAAADGGGLSTERLAAVRKAIDGAGSAVADVDAGGRGRIPGLDALLVALGITSAGSRASGDGSARVRGLLALDALEAQFPVLCSPRVMDHPGAVAALRAEIGRLQALAVQTGDAGLASVVSRLDQGCQTLGAPGPLMSLAVADMAGLLVELRGVLDSLQEADSPETLRAPEAEHAESTAKGTGVEPGTGGTAAAERMVRVRTGTLDSLARQIENLTLVRIREERRVRELRELATGTADLALMWQKAGHQLRQAGAHGAAVSMEEGIARLRLLQRELGRLVNEGSREAEQLRLFGNLVKDDLLDLRTVPASVVMDPLRRAVRDVAGRLDKQVDLVLVGSEVRLDRRIADELKDPLVHLVRNAIDHGLEQPAQRKAAGKNPTGTLEIRVEPRGHRVAVILQDDGRGLALDRIRETAVRRGLLTAESARTLPDAEAARLIFRPGFSTASEVTAISGRGVGLDVVMEKITRLQGVVSVDSVPGQSTRFLLDLPMTLAATLGLLIRAGGETFAVPADSIDRILRVKASEVGTIAGRAMIAVGERQFPFTSLAQVLALPRARTTFEGGVARPALLVSIGGQQAVLAVDEVQGQQEIVVNSLGRHLETTPQFAGATVLDDGRVIPVLNAAELLRIARPQTLAPAEGGRTRILVVDDSLTTRSMMKSILELAGYEVLPASDGEEGFRLLQQMRCNLVVSDIQMPRLDGLGLTRRIKSDHQLSSTPVILVTSLDSREDRSAGLDAGADGYLVKREVERGKLLDLVRQLVSGRT